LSMEDALLTTVRQFGSKVHLKPKNAKRCILFIKMNLGSKIISNAYYLETIFIRYMIVNGMKV